MKTFTVSVLVALCLMAVQICAGGRGHGSGGHYTPAPEPAPTPMPTDDYSSSSGSSSGHTYGEPECVLCSVCYPGPFTFKTEGECPQYCMGTPVPVSCEEEAPKCYRCTDCAPDYHTLEYVEGECPAKCHGEPEEVPCKTEHPVPATSMETSTTILVLCFVCVGCVLLVVVAACFLDNKSKARF